MESFKPMEHFNISKLNDNDYLDSKHLLCNHFEDEGLYLLKYNKSEITYDNTNTLGLFRSVITDGTNIVSFSPPKCTNSFMFDTTSDYTIERFEEGTMINMFYYNYKWIISTKTIIGADTKFFDTSKKTFSTMFWEAFEHHNLSFDKFNTEFCYSFILQHPDNRIVNQFEVPQLKLCEIYKIYNNEVYQIDIKHTDLNGIIDTCEKMHDETMETIITKINGRMFDHTYQGFVIKNSDGSRCKYINPVFAELHELRGNQSKLQYQYYKMMSENKLDDFFKYYPEFKLKCKLYYLKQQLYIQYLYEKFINCYINREQPFYKYGKLYSVNMKNLHDQYKTTGVKTTRDIVEDYVQHLDPALQMHLINSI
jgi:hypothetical protein